MGDVLSSSDLALLLTLAEEGRGEEPGPILPWFLFERMAALIPGDNLCFADLNFVQLRGENHQGILDGGQRWVDVGGGDNATQRLFWTSKRSFWAPAPPANLGRVRRWSDLYSQNELREQPLYAEFFGPLGVKHFMPSGFRHRRAIPGRCCPSGTAARTSLIGTCCCCNCSGPTCMSWTWTRSDVGRVYRG